MAALQPFCELTTVTEGVLVVGRLHLYLGQGDLQAPVCIVKPVAVILGEGHRLLQTALGYKKLLKF